MQKGLLLSLSFLMLSSCASMGERLRAIVFGEPQVNEELAPEPIQSSTPRFSENPNMFTPVERQYRRMTQGRLEEEAEIHSQAGSLWSMEGQNSYLFSQNTSRQEGDLLNVQIMGAAESQLSTKVDVIKSLLARIEEQEASRGLASEVEEPKEEAEKAEKPKQAAASSEEAATLAVKTVPTRIIERMADGNYRVKGSQPFMIGKDQYKVIVTGIVRAEDFNDEGVPTSKLLDPQYDVVSLRRVVR